MNKAFLTLLSCFLMINLNLRADNPAISKGIDFFEAGMYQHAQQYFKAQPASGLSYYYLGEIAYAEGKTDSASYYYDQGLAIDQPYPLCYIGKGKLMLQQFNVREAEATMQKAFTDKASKKDPAIYTAIGNAYAANKMYGKAKDYFKQAHDIDKNYAGSYIAEGDLLMAENKVSESANKYDMAAYVDKKNKLSRLKLAEIYTHVNTEQAIITINEILAIDNAYAPAYKQLGEMYYAKGQMKDAGEAYNQYLSLVSGTTADYARYASILYFSKDYRGSLDKIEKVLAKETENSVMKRLQAYNLFEIEDYGQALTVMTAFINDPKSNQISSDYRYYARILAKNKQDSLSIEYYNKTLEDERTNKGEILKEMAQAYESMKNYAMAGLYYEQFFENTPAVTAADYFQCGRSFYYAAGVIELATATTADSAKKINMLQKADHYFAIVAERTPSNYLGNFWRARAQSSLDPETTQGLAKPYYEQVLQIVEADPSKYSTELLECYRYLGYYYYLQEDKDASLSFWHKILSIAPDDPTAKEVVKALSKK